MRTWLFSLFFVKWLGLLRIKRFGMRQNLRLTFCSMLMTGQWGHAYILLLLGQASGHVTEATFSASFNTIHKAWHKRNFLWKCHRSLGEFIPLMQYILSNEAHLYSTKEVPHAIDPEWPKAVSLQCRLQSAVQSFQFKWNLTVDFLEVVTFSKF